MQYEKYTKNISGDDYDYTLTYQPERPYIHDYSKTMTMKIDIAFKNGPEKTKIVHTFQDVFNKIKIIDKITLGVPKIIYLVGWQYFGHDSKYPAFHKVNEEAKRPCDKDAAESLRWLMDAAKEYHTTVSLHINITDAYENSPLWETYVKNDLICKNEKGEFLKGGNWDGDQCYLICYKKDWEKGFIQKRINELLELLPIREAGTIHIDAMHNTCILNNCLCGGYEHSIEARRKIIRYFRNKGIDVTSEHLYCDPPNTDGEELFIGLQPMAWLFSQKIEDYIKRPANLICGGMATRYFQGEHTVKYKTLFGENIMGEDIFSLENFREEFLKEFCLTFLPFSFLNRRERISATCFNDGNIVAEFSEGVVSQLNDALITINDVVLRQEDDVMLPAEWLNFDNLILYSKNGGEKFWNIGGWFNSVKTVEIRELTQNGISENKTIKPVENGYIFLEHRCNNAYFCTVAM